MILFSIPHGQWIVKPAHNNKGLVFYFQKLFLVHAFKAVPITAVGDVIRPAICNARQQYERMHLQLVRLIKTITLRERTRLDSFQLFDPRYPVFNHALPANNNTDQTP